MFEKQGLVLGMKHFPASLIKIELSRMCKLYETPCSLLIQRVPLLRGQSYLYYAYFKKYRAQYL